MTLIEARQLLGVGLAQNPSEIEDAYQRLCAERNGRGEDIDDLTAARDRLVTRSTVIPAGDVAGGDIPKRVADEPAPAHAAVASSKPERRFRIVRRVLLAIAIMLSQASLPIIALLISGELFTTKHLEYAYPAIGAIATLCIIRIATLREGRLGPRGAVPALMLIELICIFGFDNNGLALAVGIICGISAVICGFIAIGA